VHCKAGEDLELWVSSLCDTNKQKHGIPNSLANNFVIFKLCRKCTFMLCLLEPK
jgi:hypothetical protein